MDQLTIRQIEQILVTIKDCQHEFIEKCEKDKRKGVQTALEKWKKRRLEEELLRSHFFEMMVYEKPLYDQGIQLIAGVDEVGRGPLAGPVVAAAVILPRDIYLPGLNDSKKVSEVKREELFTHIMNKACSVGIGIIYEETIDKINIYQATKQAMKMAVLELSVPPEHLLVDAMEIPIDIPQTAIIKGDARSVSIAASSIIAKVTRDRIMKKIGEEHPQYGFEKHMGYGTAFHMKAIQEYGISSVHRKSFSPIREILFENTEKIISG